MAKADLTAELLREYLHYDPDSGVFTWIRTPGKKQNKAFLIGKPAGKTDTYGYRIIRILGRGYSAHRLAWLHVHGYWPEETVDHIDRDRANNRIANLRDIPAGAQRQNQKCSRVSKIGLLGVHKNPAAKTRPYQGCIYIDGKFTHLGMFKTPEEAHEAYVQAKRKLHPFGVL